MKEIEKIIDQYHKHKNDGLSMVLATVYNVQDSSYRRTGARMLILEDGSWVGGISGGCLEGDTLLKAKSVMIAVNEEFVQPTVDAILEGGRSGESGEIGDGKIFVLPMDDCIRIRTGERGNEAI